MSDAWALPASWTWVMVSDVAEVVGGGTPSTSDPANFGGDIPWITPADLSRHVGTTIAKGARNLSDHGLASSGARWLPTGAVLFSSRAPVGHVAIASSPVTTNQGFKSLVLRPGIAPAFAYYWLRSAKRLAEDLASGTTFLELSGAKMATLPFPLAPAAEQARIVAKIEELLSELDAGVAELKTAQAKLQRYRQSLLKAAVQGDLTADWRAANPPAETGAELLQRILAERRARWEAAQRDKAEAVGKPLAHGWQSKYPEPEPPALRPAVLPPGWTWASAEQVCGFITKGTTPPRSLDPDSARTVPFLRVTNLTNRGVLDLADAVFVSPQTHREFLARSVVLPGDVLMNIVGPPLGQVSVVPALHEEWNVNQAIAIFRPIPGLQREFLCSYLLSDVAQNWLKARSKTTAGQTNLTLETCRSLPVPLPPVAEQARIAELVAEALAAADAMQSAIAKSLAQCTAQRQNILRAAFAGQLVPQDPADEPADVLLARLRGGRVLAGTGGRRRATGL